MRTLIICALVFVGVVITIDKLLLYPVVVTPTDINLPQKYLGEIQDPVITPSGKLALSGYQKFPGGKFDETPLTSSFLTKLRYKRWDFHSLFMPGFTVAFALADLTYVSSMQVGNIFVMIYEHGAEGVTYESLIPPWSDRGMSDTSVKGRTYYSNDNWDIEINFKSETLKEIKFRYSNIIKANLSYTREADHEGVVLYQPMSEDASNFFYTHKQYGYTVNGDVFYKGKNRKVENAHGAMDWGRGNWAFRSFWFWGCGCGKLGESILSINIGSHNGRHGQATEDHIVVDKKIIKLGVNVVSYNSTNILDTWTFSTVNKEPTVDYGSDEIHFKPEFSHLKKINLWLITSDLDQVFGSFYGKVTTSEGVIEFNNIKGWVERHSTKW